MHLLKNSPYNDNIQERFIFPAFLRDHDRAIRIF